MQAGAPAEPYKFLGHGPCDSMSRSITLSHFTASASEISHHIKALMRALRVPAPEMRGVGISVLRVPYCKRLALTHCVGLVET